VRSDAPREVALLCPVVGKRMKVHAIRLRKPPKLGFVSDRGLTRRWGLAEDAAIHLTDA
jgi:hypothetical protein